MDPLTVGAIAAPIIGGLFARKGQKSTNKLNLQIAREQMGFQERMRNTEWQAGIEDMRAAGLNPALAYSQGGASSPVGASAVMENPDSDLGRGISESFTSAMAVRQMKAATKEAEARARGAKVSADYQEAYNKAHGIKFRPDGSLEIDMENPGIAQKVQAEITSAGAAARLAEMKIPEAEQLAEMWKSLSKDGKWSIQDFMDMILPLMMRRAAGR